MRELKDIVLNKGDIIYFNDGTSHCNRHISGSIKDLFSKEFIEKITKVERPVQIKYKTIYEAPKQILTKEEKEWLENFLRPFKNRFVYIKKRIYDSFFIMIQLKNDSICLPYFKKDTMYKGMELNKKYTLKELGLFE